MLEAARNVACVGGRPLAITDCLNFGNPEKAEIAWELQEVIEGMAAACEALRIPVVSGNVSLYNETDGRAIFPTPVVGCVGLVPDVRRVPGAWRRGDAIFLVGGPSSESLDGSEYQARFLGGPAGRARPLRTSRSRPPSSASCGGRLLCSPARTTPLRAGSPSHWPSSRSRRGPWRQGRDRRRHRHLVRRGWRQGRRHVPARDESILEGMPYRRLGTSAAPACSAPSSPTLRDAYEAGVAD